MSAPTSKGTRFTKLSLENWRNFSKVEANLQRRVFLVGPNACGKSNLLDVFRFLQDVVSIGGGFQEAARSRGGVSRLRCLAARRYPEISISVNVATEENLTEWEYELRFKQDNRGRPLITRERVIQNSNLILERPNESDQGDPERLSQTYLEQVSANREFRDLASFFGSVRYLHIVPHLVRDPDRSAGKKNDPFGGDFMEQIARTTEKTRKGRLSQIRRALVVAVPQLKTLELFRDTRGTPHLRGKYEHWRPQGAWQTESDFSDGTLRLIGLLWAVLDGSGPLLLEEPELSLHSEVVTFLPQMVARIQRRTGRQILMSTHSPDLLSDSGIGSDEILLLQPDTEGTSVRAASEIEEVKNLLAGGLSPAEAVIPQTRPKDASQLPLFGE